MKHKIIFFLLALTIITNITAKKSGNTFSNTCCDTCCGYDNYTNLGPCDGYPFLQIRSQGRDSARELVGWQQFINKYCMDSRYGAFSVAVEYAQTFREEKLAHFLFGNDLQNCCELLIQGDEPCGDAASRNPKAWFADHFGLTGQYSSKVRFCPRIQNAIVDLNLYIGLDNITQGLYLRINAPIVWTKWELCMHENIVCDAADDSHPAGYMAETNVPRSDTPPSFAKYMTGKYTFGDMKTPIKYGLISNCGCTKIGLAELDISLGYNFQLEEDRHLGIFGYLAAPTGTRPCAKYLFEPIIGNGKHWEIGAGISGSWIFWKNCECEDLHGGAARYMGLWLEATVAHLFDADQCRSFDFKCKPNSRYMLLAKIGSNTDEVLLGDTTEEATAGNYQYAKNLIPAINWTTSKVKVKIPVQADIAIKLGYTRENWNFDLGYNLWARTGEKFCDFCHDDGKKYVLKGDMYLYGQQENNGNLIFPLPVSQSQADIHAGKNWPKVEDVNPRTNPRVDNPTLAWIKESINTVELYSVSDGVPYQMNGSKDPTFVTRDMLNMGKSPSSITHKLFANISYAWKNRECCNHVPFLGIGGSIEFAQDNYNDCCCCDPLCNTQCDATCYSHNSCYNTCDNYNNCNNCSCSKRGGTSLWGIWIKGGVSFN